MLASGTLAPIEGLFAELGEEFAGRQLGGPESGRRQKLQEDPCTDLVATQNGKPMKKAKARAMKKVANDREETDSSPSTMIVPVQPTQNPSSEPGPQNPQNPSVTFAPSVVSPLDAPHVIAPSQLFVQKITHLSNGAEFSSAQAKMKPWDFEAKQNVWNTQLLAGLGFAIAELLRNVPQGCLVFFPTYEMLTKCREFWEGRILSEITRLKGPPIFEEKAKDINQERFRVVRGNGSEWKSRVEIASGSDTTAIMIIHTQSLKSVLRALIIHFIENCV